MASLCCCELHGNSQRENENGESSHCYPFSDKRLSERHILPLNTHRSCSMVCVPEVLPQDVGQARVLPPQSNSLAGPHSPHCHAVRCVKILLRQTAAQEDHDATRKSGSQSQRGTCCLAVSLVGEGSTWSTCPAEESDWH